MAAPRALRSEAALSSFYITNPPALLPGVGTDIVIGFPNYLAFLALIAAWAALRRAMGTRKGLQET